MDARLLAIHCFTSASRKPADSPGLELLLGQWLGIKRPSVLIADGTYTIRCATPAAARHLCEWFGGEAHGSTVRGAIADLTS